MLCPENESLQSLSYANVYQVSGNCSVFVYDICERCLGLFPADVEDQVICSMPGCDGYVLIRTLWIVHNLQMSLFIAVNDYVNICLLDLSVSITHVVSPDTYTK